MGGPRFTIADKIFLFQGRHSIEVTSREAGDDQTQDPEPVQLETFVSYEVPKAELVAKADGSIVTRAHSSAAPAHELLYSYRIGSNGGWTTPGPARVFTAGELAGQELAVSVSDEGGKASVARLGGGSSELLLASTAAGCSTSSGTSNAGLLSLLALAGVLALRRRRAAWPG